MVAEHRQGSRTCRAPEEEESLARAARWSQVQSLVVADNFLRMLHFTSNLTEAYSLARDVGQGAVLSGLLIGSAWGLAFLGALVGWQVAKCGHAWIRFFVVLAPWFSVVVTLVYAFGANPPNGLMSNEMRVACLLTSRFVYGLGAIIQAVLLAVAGAKVTPAEEMVELEMYKQCARTLGIGGGPLLSALCAILLDETDVGGRSAVPALVLSVLWAAFGFAMALQFPRDADAMELIQSLKEEADDSIGLSDHGDDDAPKSQKTETSPLMKGTMEEGLTARHQVVLFGALYGIERAFIISALESATAFILETEFGYSTKNSGLAVGGTFIIALPVMLLFRPQVFERSKKSGDVKNGGSVADMSFMKTCTGICCASSILLFSPTSYTLLVACAIIFSSSYLASSMADGLALAHTAPGTLFSIENYVLVDQVAQNTVARLLGPMAARSFIQHHGGRPAYAAAQLVISFIGVLVCHMLHHAESITRQQRNKAKPTA